MNQLARRRKELETTVYKRPDTITVYVAGHPLRQERIELKLFYGLTLDEIVAQSSVETHISDLSTAVVAVSYTHLTLPTTPYV